MGNDEDVDIWRVSGLVRRLPSVIRCFQRFGRQNCAKNVLTTNLAIACGLSLFGARRKSERSTTKHICHIISLKKTITSARRRPNHLINSTKIRWNLQWTRQHTKSTESLEQLIAKPVECYEAVKTVCAIFRFTSARRSHTFVQQRRSASV